jgi:hypothetical protein
MLAIQDKHQNILINFFIYVINFYYNQYYIHNALFFI